MTILRKVPLWLVFVLFGAGLLLIYTSSLIGLGGRFYIGDTFCLFGILLAVAMLIAGIYGHLGSALMRLFRVPGY